MSNFSSPVAGFKAALGDEKSTSEMSNLSSPNAVFKTAMGDEKFDIRDVELFVTQCSLKDGDG